MRPACLLIHAAPEAVPLYEQSLGLPVSRIYRGGYSSSYGPPNGLAAQMTLDQAVEKYAPGTDPAAPVVLLGFSAGCWSLRHWLRDPGNRARTVAALLCDGYHAGGSDLEADLTAAHEGVVAFAREAMAGRRVLVVTHSQVIPPGYASTRSTASALLERIGAPRPDHHTSLERAGLHVLSFGGAGKAAHSAQLMEAGPQACAEHIRPALAAMTADTDPAPASLPSEPLQLRALDWCLQEAEEWGDRVVPRDRVAEYSAGCSRKGKLLRVHCANFCAAAQGFAESQVAVRGEERPPWRAGAREPMWDAQLGRRGAWHPIEEIRTTDYRPPPGALPIYWRKSPDDWRGHIERVIECDQHTFSAVGANEAGGRWVVEEATPLDHERLLGFVVDGEPPEAGAKLTDRERARIWGLVALTAEDAEPEHWRD
jgi:hypothetical protein